MAQPDHDADATESTQTADLNPDLRDADGSVWMVVSSTTRDIHEDVVRVCEDREDALDVAQWAVPSGETFPTDEEGDVELFGPIDPSDEWYVEVTEVRFMAADAVGMDGEDIIEQMTDGGLTVACPDQETASAVWTVICEVTTDEVFHIEQLPVTNDDTGTVEYIALLVRKLDYDWETGWMYSEVRETPDVDLR